MRTTLDIPEDLLEEAQELLRFKSKTDTIIVALQELVRQRRIQELKAMFGHIDLNLDVAKQRRRPRSVKRSAK